MSSAEPLSSPVLVALVTGILLIVGYGVQALIRVYSEDRKRSFSYRETFTNFAGRMTIAHRSVLGFAYRNSDKLVNFKLENLPNDRETLKARLADLLISFPIRIPELGSPPQTNVMVMNLTNNLEEFISGIRDINNNAESLKKSIEKGEDFPEGLLSNFLKGLTLYCSPEIIRAHEQGLVEAFMERFNEDSGGGIFSGRRGEKMRSELLSALEQDLQTVKIVAEGERKVDLAVDDYLARIFRSKS